ncbi:MAG: peroxide stress protein YaaA [Bacteroidota bacterium]
MKILISPAKSLNFEKFPNDYAKTDIKFKDEAWQIAKVLKDLSPKELSELMNISDKLSELNWGRNQEYIKDFVEENTKQALFAFDGDVYSGIDAKSLNSSQISYLQNNLRILSGQYGILRPLDMIMPYRLEMGTKLSVSGSKNLYDFWGSTITEELNSELKKDDVIINLASNEYFKSVDKKMLKAEIVTPVFKDYKNGKLKTISFFAKKARGMMVRYLAEREIDKNLENIKAFDYGGYRYDSVISDEKTFIFTR